jgi:hypothetical protein
VEPVNFDRSVWLDHSSPRSLVVAVFSPRFFPVSNSLRGRIRPKPESLPLSDTYLSCACSIQRCRVTTLPAFFPDHTRIPQKRLSFFVSTSPPVR